MARVVERQFKKDGMEVLTATKVESVEEQKTGVKVKAGDKELKADYLVIAEVAVGRSWRGSRPPPGS